MTMPVFYLSHGGGPWPWMPETAERNAALTQSLENLPAQLPATPKAILMVSAHWETAGTYLIQAHPQPPMVYDYYNFPEHTYHIHYPAAGQPELAAQVQRLLSQANITAELDTERGYDHGAFVPAYVMYPNANIPMIQLSINKGYDPEAHLQLGQALASLRDEGILIIGSGASYHNLRLMGPEGAQPSAEFDAWLEKSLLQSSHAERQEHMRHWTQAPYARIVHTREDHLVPLFVALGATKPTDKTTRILNSVSSTGIMNASYRFG